MNTITGRSSASLVNVLTSYENTLAGILVAAYTLKATEQQAVANNDERISFLFPINLTIAAASKFVIIKTTPTATWKRNIKQISDIIKEI